MISREEARLILQDMYNSCIDGYTNLLAEDKKVPVTLIDDINALDMAIEALSQPERPKGRWMRDRHHGAYCSECKRYTKNIIPEKFCGHCGSDNN